MARLRAPGPMGPITKPLNHFSKEHRLELLPSVYIIATLFVNRYAGKPQTDAKAWGTILLFFIAKTATDE